MIWMDGWMDQFFLKNFTNPIDKMIGQYLKMVNHILLTQEEF